MPSLTVIVRWLDAHALSIALYLALATGILRALYAMLARVLAPYPRARAAVEAVAAMAPDVLRFAGQVYALLTGRALPSTGTVAPTAITLHPPVVGGRADELRIGRATVVPPEPVAPVPFDPAAHITREQLPPIDGQRGSVDLAGLVGCLVVATALGSVLVGCPNWNRPACTTPNSYACVDDQPRWCSTTHELTPIGDEPCARTGRACVVHPDGVASCAPVADGGVR